MLALFIFIMLAVIEHGSVRINGSFPFQINWKYEDNGASVVLGMKGAEKRKLLRKRTGVGVVTLHLIYALNHITTSHSVEVTVILLCKYAVAVRLAGFCVCLVVDLSHAR
jgi:hypothetical protein